MCGFRMLSAPGCFATVQISRQSCLFKSQISEARKECPCFKSFYPQLFGDNKFLNENFLIPESFVVEEGCRLLLAINPESVVDGTKSLSPFPDIPRAAAGFHENQRR